MTQDSTKDHGALIDTVKIHADNTWQLKSSTWHWEEQSGTWELQPGGDLWPGDRLWLKIEHTDPDSSKTFHGSYLHDLVSLQGDRFMVPGWCWEKDKKVYKRVTP